MSLLDSIIDILATPDWISPTIGIARTVGKKTDVITFQGCSINEAKRRCRHAGITVLDAYIQRVDGYRVGVLVVPAGDGHKTSKLIT